MCVCAPTCRVCACPCIVCVCVCMPTQCMCVWREIERVMKSFMSVPILLLYICILYLQDSSAGGCECVGREGLLISLVATVLL